MDHCFQRKEDDRETCIGGAIAAVKLRDFSLRLRELTPQMSLQDLKSSLVAATADALQTRGAALYMIDPQTGAIECTSTQEASERLTEANMAVIDDCLTDAGSDSMLKTISGSYTLLAPMHSSNGVAGVLAAYYDSSSEAECNRVQIEVIAAQTALYLSLTKTIHQTQIRLDEFAGDNHDLSCQAHRDGLTELLNHRTLQSMVKDMCARGEQFSLIMCDVDHFKRYNDTFGHPQGDVVLKNVARVLSSSIRQSDFAARYGGEEFALVLRAGKKDAVIVAERIRRSVEDIKLEQGSVTISMGVAQFPVDALSAADLVAQADQALYTAKRAGRNRVIAAEANEQRSEAA